jgi:WD40 repeat protein
VAIFLDDAYIFDARTGASLARLRGHTDNINSAVYSWDGRRILTAAADSTARVWDASTGHLLEVLRGHTRALADADYSRDGAIATLSEDGTVRVWDAAPGTLELRPSNGAEDAEFSPDGRLVVSSAEEASVLQVWDAATGKPVKALRVPGETFNEARFSPRGDVLATGHNRRVRLWSTANWTSEATIEPIDPDDPDDLVSGFTFSRDGSRLLTRTFDGVVMVSDLPSGRPVGGFSAPDIEAAELTDDGNQVVGVWPQVKSVGTTQFFRGRVGSWALPNGAGPRLWHAEAERSLSDLEASPDGRLLLASGPEHAVVLDAAAGKLVATIEEPKSASGLLDAAHFSPDGMRVITADDDNLARIWDTRTGRRLLDLDGHTSSVNDARFSPDGQFAVTISSDGTSRVWDAETGATVQVFSGHARGGLVEAVRFSPDGARVLTADGVAVRVFLCKLCVPVDRQLAFARTLVARPLSAAERRASGLS